MKRKQEKKVLKFLKSMSTLNPRVPFIYNNEGMVVADSTDLTPINGEFTLMNLDLPNKYFASFVQNTGNRVAKIKEAKTLSEVTMLSVDECNSKDCKMDYSNYYEYSRPETTIGSIFRKAANRVKNGFKYLFSKRAEVSKNYGGFTPKANVNPTIAPEKPVVTVQPLATIPEIKKEEVKKAEPKKVVVKPAEPVKVESKTVEPKKVVVKPAINQKHLLIKKVYDFKNIEAYNKLGEYERMFIDDVKAEGLNPSDNEFRQMLNERCVDKKQIAAYYETLNNNKNDLKVSLIKSDSIDAQQNLQFKYINLDEYEKEFVEDAIAEGLSVEDNEFRQMLNERCVSSNKVLSFMNSYKNYLLHQKVLVNEYIKLNKTVDFKTLTINDLRKQVSNNKFMLTQDELAKQKNSTLKKAELVSILERIEYKEAEKEVKKGLTL